MSRRFYGLGGRTPVRYCGEADVYNTETPVEEVGDEGWSELVEHDDQAETYSLVHYDLGTPGAGGRVGVSIRDAADELVDRAGFTDYFRVPEDASYDPVKNLLCVQFTADEYLYEPEYGPVSTRLDTSGQICVRRCDGKPMSVAARKAFWTAVMRRISSSSERFLWFPDAVDPRQVEVAAKEQRVHAKARVRVGWELDGLAGRSSFPRCAPRFKS